MQWNKKIINSFEYQCKGVCNSFLYIDFKFDGLYISLVIVVVYIMDNCKQWHFYCAHVGLGVCLWFSGWKNTFHPISPL